MTQLRNINGALPFFAAIFLNAFVDLGHKIVIQNTIFKLYDGQAQVILTAIVNGLILLPFILLLSPAGYLSDNYRKTAVMRTSAWVAVVVCIAITYCYYQGLFWPAFTLTFLLASQSAIYSPAKSGFIKELFGKSRLGEANGIASALAIIAILSGTFIFSMTFELWYPTGVIDSHSVLKAIAPIGWLLILNSLLEVWMVYHIPQPPTDVSIEKTPFPIGRYLRGALFADDLSPLAKRKVIRLAVIGLATFWAVGQVMVAAFPAHAKSHLGLSNTILVQGIIACSGIGIALGSVIAGRISKNYIEVGILPIAASGLAIGLLFLPSLNSLYSAGVAFLFIGLMGGMFIVPLNALIQFHAEHNRLGKTLAANNWVQNVAMLAFLTLTAAFAYFGLSSQTLLYIIAFVAIIGSFFTLYQLPQSFVRFLLASIITTRYKISVQGLKNMPSKGGVLMLGNHVSWIDWAIVQIASPRPVRFVMIKNIYERWYLTWFFDLFGCIPIETGRNSSQALNAVTELLNNGEVVCLFPEGTISRTGHLVEFKRGYEKACINANEDVVILPFYLRGLWGSQFSRSSDYVKKASKGIATRDIIVAFGKELNKDTPSDVLKRRILDLTIQSWQEYVNTLPTLSNAWIDTAKKIGRKVSIIDTMGTQLSGTESLVGTISIARRMKTLSPEKNIGILLPTSVAGVLCNMATLMLGKTIVNLNYSAPIPTLLSAIKQADIKTIYTSARFVKKLHQKGISISEIFDSVNVVYLEDIKKGISTIEKALTLLSVTLSPAGILKRVMCRKQSPQATAAILFSSGSEGSPKGIELSHRNIIANVKQITEVLHMESNDKVLANLPLFHAFGLTVTQFVPLIEGLPMVCHADPTDALGAAKAIATNKVSIMFGTSTFLRLYVRNNKVDPLMLSSLRLVVAGAERLKKEVRMSFKEKFNKDIYEGYGATETTPVASVNIQNKLGIEDWKVQKGEKRGSVGMPLPGTSCKVVDPSSFEELNIGESGMVLIGGVQVMQGYLKDPEKTERSIRVDNEQRWYITGDKGYIDEDGFLYIIDRYSRFAKIGGEMISLSYVENAISACLSRTELDEDMDVVVVNLPDDKKGEKLITLHTMDIDEASLKGALLKDGINSLVIPSQYFKIDTLPKLGSGKTDFSLAKKIAAELIGNNSVLQES